MWLVATYLRVQFEGALITFRGCYYSQLFLASTLSLIIFHTRSPHPLCIQYAGPFPSPQADQALSCLSTSKFSSLCLNAFSLLIADWLLHILKGSEVKCCPLPCNSLGK